MHIHPRACQNKSQQLQECRDWTYNEIFTNWYWPLRDYKITLTFFQRDTRRTLFPAYGLTVSLPQITFTCAPGTDTNGEHGNGEHDPPWGNYSKWSSLMRFVGFVWRGGFLELILTGFCDEQISAKGDSKCNVVRGDYRNRNSCLEILISGWRGSCFLALILLTMCGKCFRVVNDTRTAIESMLLVLLFDLKGPEEFVEQI